MLVVVHSDVEFFIIVCLSLKIFSPSAYTEYTREDPALHPNGTINEFLGPGPIFHLNWVTWSKKIGIDDIDHLMSVYL